MSFKISDIHFEVSIQSIYPERNALYPTIAFNLKFSNISSIELKINPHFNFRLKTQDKTHYVGPLLFDKPSIPLAIQGTYAVRARLILNHYGLKKIEELRENVDININIYCEVDVTKYSEIVSCTSQLEYTIAKSDWVEKHLDAYKYKEVVLLEVQKIDFPNFAEAAELLNDAWKKRSMGQFSDVLVDCRKALEFTTNAVKKKGFITEDDEGKKIPDWNKFLDDKDLGDINGTIIKKITGFLAPAAHHGKTFNIEDADYALLITYSIVNYVMNKLQRSAR